ncbi:MAG: type II/IV secretion system ATPase subunit [Candidatus Aenigmatarchaeota archaeon]
MLGIHRLFSKKEHKGHNTHAEHGAAPMAGTEFKILPDKKLEFKADSIKNGAPVRYALIRPYAYAKVRWDKVSNEFLYEVDEPKLSEEENEILERLKRGLIETINVSTRTLEKKDSIIKFLEERTKQLLDMYEIRLESSSYLKILYYLYRDFVGLNEIEPLMNDDYIEDVSCDGLNIPLYIIHQKLGSVKTNVIFKDNEKLRGFVIKLAEKTDRYISYASPVLDGTLPDGSRVQATLAGDVTTRGPTFSIRKFRETPFTPVDMTNMNTASLDMLAYLWFVVEHGANILIAGGVSTGKTTLLNCLSLFIPPSAKIVSIEDTKEINLPHENWISSVSRPAFGGKTGEVTMFDLLKGSFRQNPDYLIVGEVRGKEASVMFQGMASGHASISTMHAGSVDDVIKRLETDPINLSPGLLETLDMVIIMVHAKEKGHSARRVKEIMEIESVDWESGEAKTKRISEWHPDTDGFSMKSVGDSYLLKKIATESGISAAVVRQDIESRKKVLEWLSRQRLGWKEVSSYISMYEKNRSQMLSLIQNKNKPVEHSSPTSRRSACDKSGKK